MSVNRTPKSLPVTFIDSGSVNQRVKNFQTIKHPLLSQAIGREESSSAWYSIKHLEEIMRELYYLNADGVRVYFGSYDQSHEKYPGQLCLLFVPTAYNEAANKHADIIIDQEENFGIRKMAEPQQVEDFFKGLNFGALCKPDCDDHELSYPQ
jgi:hypothetical protein